MALIKSQGTEHTNYIKIKDQTCNMMRICLSTGLNRSLLSSLFIKVILGLDGSIKGIT